MCVKLVVVACVTDMNNARALCARKVEIIDHLLTGCSHETWFQILRFVAVRRGFHVLRFVSLCRRAWWGTSQEEGNTQIAKKGIQFIDLVGRMVVLVGKELYIYRVHNNRARGASLASRSLCLLLYSTKQNFGLQEVSQS